MSRSKCKYCGKDITWINESLDDTIPMWKVYERVGEKIIKHKCEQFKKQKKEEWVKNHLKEIIAKRKYDKEFHDIVK